MSRMSINLCLFKAFFNFAQSKKYSRDEILRKMWMAHFVVDLSSEFPFIYKKIRFILLYGISNPVYATVMSLWSLSVSLCFHFY